MNNNANLFSDTEDTKLKRFLTGGKVYAMLAVAIISAIVVILTVAPIISIMNNAEKADNFTPIHEIDVFSDLDGTYVKGDVYKFVAELGYIAPSKAAVTEYYYLMYLDVGEEQYAVLVSAPVETSAQLNQVISSYLSYAKNPEAGFNGSALQDFCGRFKKMSANEQQLFEEGLTQCAVKDIAVSYTLQAMRFPEKSDTVPYFFVAVPFAAALVVSICFYFYGMKLETAREKAKESPYPYLNRKTKK